MPLHRLPLKSVFFLLCMGSGTNAQDAAWRTEGEWTIYRNTAANGSNCFASRVFEEGIEVQVGFDPNNEGGFFAVYNPEWTHINEGEKGTVKFDFGEEKFAGDAFGRYQKGVPGGYAFFNNPAFAEAFARRQTVKVSGSNGRVFEMDLTGTSKAAAAVRECHKSD